MTLSSASPVITYVGDASANQFSFPYPVFVEADFSVSVVKTSVTPTVDSTLTIGVDYTVSGLNAAGAPASSSGLITLVNASQAWLTGGNLSIGYSIVIERVVSIVQLTSIRNQGDFYPADFENALDYLTMICQQLEQAISVLQDGSQVVQPSIIITDEVNGHTYRLLISNGVFGTEQVT